MPTSTPNLSLYKYNTNTDGNMTFNITNSLNNNWDKIDTYCKNLSDNKAEKSAVNSALALKADTSAVNSALALKADLTDLDSKANITQLHALKGYEDEGELLTDAEGLSDVIKYAHSSFDLSKFTVVGSPAITDDGIASGFNSSNYIRTPSIDFTKPFEIIVPFRLNAILQNKCIFHIIGPSGWYNYCVCSSAQLVFYYQLSDSTTGSILLRLSQEYILNKTYYVDFIFNGYAYILRLLDENKNIIQENSFETTLSLYNSSDKQLNIGYATNGSGYNFSNGSIDLKQFSITVDGVEVFSGNKTGIDTIKPDDYEVVGNPTISADGIASGFSESNYITLPYDWANNCTNFKFNIKFHTDTLSSTKQYLIGYSSNGFGCGLNINSSNRLAWYAWRDTDNSTVASIDLNTILSNNTDYFAECILNNGVYSLNLNDANNVLIESKTANTSYNFNISSRFKLGNDGQYTPAEPFINGSIDLNSFKIYVYGNLVNQPCLKIPYTKGSEQYGGKYVNAQYLPRVKDAYEQGFTNDYFTLDEANGTYTLPMGNLYGMIEKRARDIAHPVGEPFFRFDDTIYEDEIRLEGAEVEKGLYKFIEDKLAAYCTAGSTDDTICLPNFIDRVPWGSNDFGYISAGLPNITGTTTKTGLGIEGTAATFSGAFSTSISGNGNSVQGGSDNTDGYFNGQLKFNASKSNSIYGNSTTVQPPSFKVRWLARWK